MMMSSGSRDAEEGEEREVCRDVVMMPWLRRDVVLFRRKVGGCMFL